MDDNPYDKTSRQLTRRYPMAVLCWLLALSSQEMRWLRWLDTRNIPSPWERDRTSDAVAFLRDQAAGGMPWAVPIEFQIDPDPLMFGRLLVFLGHIWMAEKPDPERGDRFCLAAIVVNLRGRGNASRTHEWAKAKLRTQLQVVERNLETAKASDLLALVKDGLLSSIVLAFIPLMLGGDDPDILREWFALASAENDDNIRADLKVYARIFAEAAGREDRWHPPLKEWNVIKSKVIEEYKDEGRVAGVAETVVAVLEAKFGSLPAELNTAIINTTDLAKLKGWAPLAARAITLDEFRNDARL